MPLSSPYLHRTGSAPPFMVSSPTYAYASAEVRTACMGGLKTDHSCVTPQPMASQNTHAFLSFPLQVFYPGSGYGPPSYPSYYDVGSPQAPPHHPPQAVAFVQYPPQQQHHQPQPQPQQRSTPPHPAPLQHQWTT